MGARFLETPVLADLPFAGAFALWGIRACAVGHQECCVLTQGYRAHLDKDWPEALSLILLLTRIIGADGRRKVSVGLPGAPRLTSDELSLIALLAAAQAGDEDRVNAHFAWLLAAQPEETARKVALRLGALFARTGLTIDSPHLEIAGTCRPKPDSTFLLVDGGRA